MIYKQSPYSIRALTHSQSLEVQMIRIETIAGGSERARWVWPADILRAGIGGSVWAENLNPLSTVRGAHTGLTADLQLRAHRLFHPGALCIWTHIYAHTNKRMQARTHGNARWNRERRWRVSPKLYHCQDMIRYPACSVWSTYVRSDSLFNRSPAWLRDKTAFLQNALWLRGKELSMRNKMHMCDWVDSFSLVNCSRKREKRPSTQDSRKNVMMGKVNAYCTWDLFVIHANILYIRWGNYVSFCNLRCQRTDFCPCLGCYGRQRECATFHAFNCTLIDKLLNQRKKNIWCENNTCYWCKSDWAPSSCWLTEAARTGEKLCVWFRSHLLRGTWRAALPVPR